jgi:hypothetical protein
MDITLTNIGSQDPLSWQLDNVGSFFSATPGNGTTPTSIRITPDNFNQNKTSTYTGTITIDVVDPDFVEGAPHTTQVTLKVINAQVHQVFLPGVLR